MKKVFAIVIGGVLVAGLVYLNDRFRGSPGLSWGIIPNAPLSVEVETPERRTIIQMIHAPGKVEPVIEVDMSSQVVGKIVKLPVRDGDWVKAGDLLAKIDAAAFESRVRSAEARVKRLEAAIQRTHADLEKAQRDAARARKLFAQNAASSDELADNETLLRTAVAANEMAVQERIEALASLEAARKDLSYTEIRSPIDGLVSQMLVEQGEVVIPGTMNNMGTVMMVVSDTTQMQVRAQIDEADVPKVKAGQRAWIYLTADSRTPLRGSVERVTPKGVQQAEAATFEARILIEDASESVRSGMTANVEIAVDQHDGALTVPIQAVRHRKRKDLPAALRAQAKSDQKNPATRPQRAAREPDAEYLNIVFVAVEGRSRMRLVETGISDETHVEIRQGLTLGDRVIVGPQRMLDALTDERTITVDDGSNSETQP